ncbi:MAG: transglutaminase-like domain-containing protein [Fibrobacteria bacterium]
MAGPSAVLKKFDSLMEAGRFPEARRLCAGQMLRMFAFMAMAQSKIAPYVDTARSREETLEERSGGNWAYAKVRSRTFFLKPFMGVDSLISVQAAHLYKSPRGWLIAEMEELEGKDAPVALRRGIPTGLDGTVPDSGAAAAAAGEVDAPESGAGKQAGLFPVSARAPERAGAADRVRYRLRMRNGDALTGIPLDGNQSLILAESPSQWILECRRAPPPHTGKRGRTAPAAFAPDSLRAYLSGNAYLNLDDSLLRRRASAITASETAGAETEPDRIALAVYSWVAENFRFQMGSVLFGTSSETLRDMTGDCSEAAILTAALLRSRGVPARVALGFASLGRGVFIGHAWCEAWLDGGWVGVDAALREFPAGAERVKLAALDGRADMRIAATNLMLRNLSNLDIQILAAWEKDRGLPLLAYPDNSAEAGRFFQRILDGMDEKNGIGKEGKKKPR